MRVAIIGAGISGLALAYYLQKLGVPYDLLEASEYAGGNIHTITLQDFILELGPNALQKSPELHQLLHELKLQDQVMPVAANAHSRFVLRDGNLHKLPDSVASLLSNTAFSWQAKRRFLQEKDTPAADVPNETVSHFFERRFGKEITAYVLNPFATDYCGGDPEKLLVSKALPKLKELETKYGSVLKGLARKQINWHDSFSFANGMSTLPNAIAAKLIALHLNHCVEMITRGHGKYILSCSTPSETDTQEYDFLVLALPAHQAADLLQFTFPGLAAALLNVNYPPLAVVHSVYNREDVHHPLKGFGAWHAKAETTLTTGSIWNSSLYDGRCRPHEVLFTTFVDQFEVNGTVKVDHQELLAKVNQELCSRYQICSEKPIFEHLHLWKQGMPQFDLFIEDAHQMAAELEQQQVFISANWQAGVSVTDCIRHAKELAHKINLKRSGTLNNL